jgi:nitrite reductase (NO-forming)
VVDPARTNETVAIPTDSLQIEAVYTLQTTMGRSPGLAFVGVGGETEGIINPTLTAAAGDTVVITLINGHARLHDLTIEGLGVATKQLSSAGQQATIHFSVRQAGDYVYYCSIPGHREAGMTGILQVSTP